MKLCKRNIIYKDKGNKRADGFSLIELLFSLMILSFGILAIAKMQGSSLLGSQNANSITEGTTWAEEKIEYLMSCAYTHSDLSSGTHSEAQGNYTVTWNVTNNSPITNTKTVTVDVTWTAPGGAQKMSSLDFIVADII